MVGDPWIYGPEPEIQRFPSSKRIVFFITITSADPLLSREYLLTGDGRWIMARRSVDRSAEPIFKEVSRSQVIQFFDQNRILRPPELRDERPLENGPPRWDFDTLTLSYGGITCRHYKRHNAPNQFKLLNSFQSADWPRSIDSPFSLDRTLRETIDELNEHLAEDSPIRFGVEGRKPVWFPRVAPACSG
jgi:hypothetical protein